MRKKKAESGEFKAKNFFFRRRYSSRFFFSLENYLIIRLLFPTMSKLKTRLNFNSHLFSSEADFASAANTTTKIPFSEKLRCHCSKLFLSGAGGGDSRVGRRGTFFSSRKAVGHTGGHVPNFFPFPPGEFEQGNGGKPLPIHPPPSARSTGRPLWGGEAPSPGSAHKTRATKKSRKYKTTLLIGLFT